MFFVLSNYRTSILYLPLLKCTNFFFTSLFFFVKLIVPASASVPYTVERGPSTISIFSILFKLMKYLYWLFKRPMTGTLSIKILTF